MISPLFVFTKTIVEKVCHILELVVVVPRDDSSHDHHTLSLVSTTRTIHRRDAVGLDRTAEAMRTEQKMYFPKFPEFNSKHQLEMEMSSAFLALMLRHGHLGSGRRHFEPSGQ